MRQNLKNMIKTEKGKIYENKSLIIKCTKNNK